MNDVRIRAPLPAVLPPRARTTLDHVDERIADNLARVAVPFLRLGLGIVFLWFGALKLVPGLSPAASLATRTIEALTFGVVLPEISLPVLGIGEVLIGLGLLTGLAVRATLLLLIVQMAGTITPLFLFPAETFSIFPIAPTLEGQYIIKNIVLVGAAMVIGATVRGGTVTPDPVAERR